MTIFCNNQFSISAYSTINKFVIINIILNKIKVKVWITKDDIWRCY